MRYWKYHGLGNDYLVIAPAEMGIEPDPEVIRLICYRNYWVESDGILLGLLDSRSCDFGLKIFIRGSEILMGRNHELRSNYRPLAQRTKEI